MKLQFLKHYFKNKDKIYNYFLYRLNFDKSLAEDMTSDVFLRAYKKFDTFDEEKASFTTWIFTIAHNLLVNFYRDHKKTASLDDMELSGFKVKDEVYLNNLINRVEVNLIIDKMQVLPSNYAQIIVLRMVNQFSFREIAKIMDLSEGNARVTFMRAMRKLTDQLE